MALDAARQSASTIGALVALANGASLVGAALAARVPPRWSARVVLGGIVVTGVATGADRRRSRGTPGSPPSSCWLSGIAAGAIQVLGQATAAESVHPEERGDAIAVTGTFRAAALFAAPLAVAGLVVVLPARPGRRPGGGRDDGPGHRAAAPHPPAPGGALMRPSLRSTSTRTFAAIPAVVLAEQALSRRPLHPRWLPALAWGFLQYKLAGSYRIARAGGPPGMSQGRPERLVTTGDLRAHPQPHVHGARGVPDRPDAAHPVTARAGRDRRRCVPWFDERARADHERLVTFFGEPYEEYAARVPRWLPGLPTDRRRPIRRG